MRTHGASLDLIEWPYQFGSDSFGSRVDARIRPGSGADATRDLFSLLSTRVSCMQQEVCFHIRTTMDQIHASGIHSGPVWIGSKREQIQNGSAPVCTKSL